MRGVETDSIAIALRREKSLLEQVLYLAVCELDMLEAGRLEDVEEVSLLRAERMREFAMAEANIDVRMSDIENDPTINPQELAELSDLNLQITRIANSLMAIDERAEHLLERRHSRAAANA